MNIQSLLRDRFKAALSPLAADPAPLLELIARSQDPKFGDYQANCAMPLGKQLGKPPREIAQQIVANLQVADFCHPPEIAGPGFINLKLKDEWIGAQLQIAAADERLAIPPTAKPRTYVIDYSAPNVAKTMHVGHIRSTVIGDALYRTLKFLGHQVVSDNHIGDWGTQFGMIIYGWKHFKDEAAYASSPVAELNRLYRLVRKIMDYYEGKRELPKLQAKVAKLKEVIAELESQRLPADAKPADAKKHAKSIEKAVGQLKEAGSESEALAAKLAEVEGNKKQLALITAHAAVEEAVLAETARLHAGDANNLELWKKFVPTCRFDIQDIYDRLDVRFDVELGESFYHDQLGDTVREFEARNLAKESEGATCIFLEGFDAPMIIRKRDGAFLYATTDLATIRYRMNTWKPDAILYVVDHRQGDHFEKLFAATRLWGYQNVELKHVSFGTILGEDGKPFKTRSGDTVGLRGLLDDAVSNALRVVTEIDEKKKNGAELSAEERQRVADVLGIAAIKYFDLSQNRTSDYKFSFERMLDLHGDTATYMEYAYARCHGIFIRGEVNREEIRGAKVTIEAPEERALAIDLLKFGEALESVAVDYRPNILTNYLYDLAKRFSAFFENCPVLKAPEVATRDSRLVLCDLTARTIGKGLELLGIQVVDRM